MSQLKEQHHVPISQACDALNLARATYYRAIKPKPSPPSVKKRSVRALSSQEQDNVLETLNSPRFVDVSPYQAYAELLDEGTYLCSVSTMYRILRQNNQVRERRNQLVHPNYEVPRLTAQQHWDG